ncbi:hypothetical protein Tco_1420845 [Tanacetum coccineum]
MSGEWLKFNNHNFSLDSRKEFRKRFSKIRIKEVECPKGLDFEEFGTLHEGTALQNLDQFSMLVLNKMIGALLLKLRIGRHIGKEKVTLDDLFLLHSMDGGVSVDVPWHVAKFLCDKAKGSKRKSLIVGAHLIRKIVSYYGLMTLGSLMNVTLGPETSSMSVAKLVDLGICRYNGMGIGEMVAEIPEVAGDDDVGAGEAEIGVVGRHPNMSNVNRLRAMDERIGEIVCDIDELTYVVSGISKHCVWRNSVDVPWHVAKFLCDKAKGSKRKSLIIGAHLIGKIASYYGLMTLGSLMNVTLGPETSSMSIPEVVGDDDVGVGQAEIGGVGRHPNMSNANRLSAMDERLGEIVNDVDELTYCIGDLLAYYRIDHTRYDGTHYFYVPSIPDLGVNQGVNFMSGTPGYSTAPSPSPFTSQLGMFGDAHPSTSRNQDDMNED